jgi:hypothetical protein
MPDPYHSYFIAGADWQTPGSGIAIVIRVSGAGPDPNPPHFVELYGGAAAAVAKARTALEALHPGLKVWNTCP